jgi:hypothetical protein
MPNINVQQWSWVDWLGRGNPALSREGRRSRRRGHMVPGGSPRVLIRPEPGFYVMRLGRGAPLVPALIYQLCPMVVPEPQLVVGPHPDDWCRPLDRSPLLRARIDGREVAVDRVWTSRSLRPVSAAEYAFRVGMLRRWARQSRQMPEARPHRAVDFASLPPLF